MNEQPYKSSLKPTSPILILSLISLLLLTAGNLQAGTSDSHQRMVDLLQQVGTEATENNPYFGYSLADRLGHQLASLPEETPLRRRWELTFQLAQAELNLGREEEAVKHLNMAEDLHKRYTERFSTAAANRVNLSDFSKIRLARLRAYLVEEDPVLVARLRTVLRLKKDELPEEPVIEGPRSGPNQ